MTRSTRVADALAAARPAKPSHLRSVVVMSTLVTIHVVGDEDGGPEAAIERAFGWFHHVEQTCSRFVSGSETTRLSAHVGEPVAVSALLFETVQFAMAVAEASHGAFDPTVGARMAERGFNREHRSGEVLPSQSVDHAASYRDVCLDPAARTITLTRPLTIDLGAVAKGVAVDLAAKELASFGDFAIDAGGDLYLAGLNPAGEPWSVGIRHPRRDGEILETVRVSGAAVCSSGDYERRRPDGEQGHHILDPRTGESPDTVASVTVIAPTATIADALATAAFVLGTHAGLEFLARHDVEGLIVSAELERFQTRGFGA